MWNENLADTWRAEDLELRLLFNARLLWKRYVEMIVNDTVSSVYSVANCCMD